jgi:arylsulfatase A-like enzyme
MRRLYYAKMAHIDSLIGTILDTLEAKGELDNTVIIFWSDHGDRLCDRGKYAKGVFYDESARIPIILRLPGNPGAGAVCRSIVSINDLFPTILDAAGIEGVPCFGASLVPATRDPEKRFHEAVFGEIRHGADHHTMIRTDQYKMLINQKQETLQLFDMVNDPDELQNLAGREDMATTEAALKARILTWLMQTTTVQARQGGIRPTAKA